LSLHAGIIQRMNTRRWGQDAIQDLRDRYRGLAGQDYISTRHKDRSGLQGELLKVVKEIKTLEASQRQLEIKQKGSSTDAEADEFAALQQEIDYWSQA
jgi:hypothetical protein